VPVLTGTLKIALNGCFSGHAGICIHNVESRLCLLAHSCNVRGTWYTTDQRDWHFHGLHMKALVMVGLAGPV